MFSAGSLDGAWSRLKEGSGMEAGRELYETAETFGGGWNSREGAITSPAPEIYRDLLDMEVH